MATRPERRPGGQDRRGAARGRPVFPLRDWHRRGKSTRPVLVCSPPYLPTPVSPSHAEPAQSCTSVLSETRSSHWPSMLATRQEGSPCRNAGKSSRAIILAYDVRLRLAGRPIGGFSKATGNASALPGPAGRRSRPSPHPHHRLPPRAFLEISGRGRGRVYRTSSLG